MSEKIISMIAIGVLLIAFGCTNLIAVNQSRISQKSIQVEVKKKPSDKQWKLRDTRTIDMLSGFKPYEKKIQLNTYGGRADMQAESTGFFYPKKINNRWWLVDPEGNLFIHTAIVSVYTGLSDYSRQTTLERFGSEERWAQFSADLLSKYSFNGCGGWSQANLLRKTTKPPVYTLSWDFMRDFATSKRLAWQVSGHHGYPDQVWPVFHPDFESFCDTNAQNLAATKDDPYCIGHFSDNELQLKEDMLDRTLKLDLIKYPEMKYNIQEAKRWLSERKGKPARLEDVTDQDRTDFIGHMFDRYFKLTTTAIRKYDPNHLCLGPRLHGLATRLPVVLATAGKYVDVISVNYYYKWDPDPERMAMWSRESGKPFMITEWYAKGQDSGLSNTSGAGWLVKTQADRAKFYHNFSLGLMESENCVGWHWFKYVDNNPKDTSVDPSNRDSNKGVVTYDYKPYTELLDSMKRLNDNVYPLIDYFDSITIIQPLSRAVFQRDEKNIAMVPVKGIYEGSPTRIEARAIVMDGFTGTPTDWHIIDASPTGGSFSASIPVAAGGWYSIQVRPFKGGKPGATSIINEIGVGEVFITSGQSNSANYGSPGLTPNHDTVSAWTGNNWRHAYDPQPIASGRGGSPWSRLGDILVERLGVPIAFISTGVGSTKVGQWVPGARYYSRLESAINAAGPSGMRAILWHQGESDSIAGTTASTYARSLNSIIDQTRTYAGWDIPWGVALVSYHPSSSADKEEEVRKGHIQVIEGAPLVFAGPDTDTFHTSGWLAGTVHFNAAGLMKHARRWETAIVRQFFTCDSESNKIDDFEMCAD